VIGVALSCPVRLNASPGGYREERHQIAIDFVAVATPPVIDAANRAGVRANLVRSKLLARVTETLRAA